MFVRPGIDALLEKKRDLIRGAHVGAVVHPASVLSDLRHTIDALSAAGDFQLISLLGPQHGARGEKQDKFDACRQRRRLDRRVGQLTRRLGLHQVGEVHCRPERVGRRGAWREGCQHGRLGGLRCEIRH